VSSAPDTSDLLVTLKRAASGLKDAGIGFALAGSFAAYARGAGGSSHDVDFVLREEDVDDAVAALTARGMEHRASPEDWLEKVYDQDRLVDLIFRPSNRPVDGPLLNRAEDLSVAAITMPVLTATDMVIMRLQAYTEKTCDFSEFLPVLRALREQVDWRQVADETADSPYAYVLMELLGRLGVIEPRREIPMSEDVPEYLAAHIQDRLAERADELGIRVEIRGPIVYLCGEVASEEQRRMMEEIAREAAPGRQVRNEVHVVVVHEPEGEETLS
jgi:hypothetical protein